MQRALPGKTSLGKNAKKPSHTKHSITSNKRPIQHIKRSKITTISNPHSNITSHHQTLALPTSQNNVLKKKKKSSLLSSFTRSFATDNNNTPIQNVDENGNVIDNDGAADDGPVYRQQFLRAKNPVSKQDQAAYNAALAKQQQTQQQEQQQQGADDDDYDDNIPLTAEELFYEMPPLSLDMFELEPRDHRMTLIWLPDCFESHQLHGKSFQMMMAKQLRVVIPNPPVRECTVLGGEEQKAWYDVMSIPFKPDQCDLDYTGMKVSMYQLHQLIRDEAIRVGQKIAPFNTPAHEIERLGSERIFVGGFGQGAALAMFAGLRYPKRLAGLISHSGYIPFIDQTAEAAKLLEQNQRKEWELEMMEQQKINEAKKLTQQTTQEHFLSQANNPSHTIGEKVFDISVSAPNVRTPLYVLHNHTDNVFPWLELAQPSYIKAVKAPLKCKMELRMGKSEGHSIASLDLLEMNFWKNDILAQKEREMPPSDHFEREKLRELGEFGDSTIVVAKYSPHSDRVTMPWAAARVLESANVAQQDVRRVEELLKLIPKHPERLEEIANEIDLLNREADDELWKAYLVEANQFIKHHEKYMTQRREQDQLRWSKSQNNAHMDDDSNNNKPKTVVLDHRDKGNASLEFESSGHLDFKQ